MITKLLLLKRQLEYAKKVYQTSKACMILQKMQEKWLKYNNTIIL